MGGVCDNAGTQALDKRACKFSFAIFHNSYICLKFKSLLLRFFSISSLFTIFLKLFIGNRLLRMSTNITFIIEVTFKAKLA